MLPMCSILLEILEGMYYAAKISFLQDFEINDIKLIYISATLVPHHALRMGFEGIHYRYLDKF